MHKYGLRFLESFLDVLIMWFMYSDMLYFTRLFLSTPLLFYCEQLYMYMYLLFLLTISYIYLIKIMLCLDLVHCIIACMLNLYHCFY